MFNSMDYNEDHSLILNQSTTAVWHNMQFFSQILISLIFDSCLCNIVRICQSRRLSNFCIVKKKKTFNLKLACKMGSYWSIRYPYLSHSSVYQATTKETVYSQHLDIMHHVCYVLKYVIF